MLTIEFWRGFWQNAFQAVTAHGLRLVTVLLLYWVVRAVSNRAIDAGLGRLLSRQGDGGAQERASRLRTLQGLVKSLVGYVLFFVFAIMALQALTVDVTGLITTAGVGGLAVGFGAQRLVRDVIAGFFIIMEDQFGVGEYVTIGPATGTVEELGMRITRVRDDQGKLWILANGDITTVTNHSRAPVQSFVDIGLAPDTDVARAQQVIDEAGRELMQEGRPALLEAPRALGVAAFDAARTTVRVGVVAEPRAQGAEQMRVREAVRRKLAEAGITVA